MSLINKFLSKDKSVKVLRPRNFPTVTKVRQLTFININDQSEEQNKVWKV